MRFVYIPEEWTPNKNHGRSPVPVKATLAYKKWLRLAYEHARKVHRRIHFDLVHHLRRNTFREPGHLWRMGVPFVWGPTGGTNGVPWRLMGALDWKHRLLHAARNVITAGQLRFSPRVRRAANSASVIIAQTDYDKRKFSSVLGVRSTLIPEQAADPELGVTHRFDGSRSLRVAVVGRHVASKALPIALQSFAAPAIQARVELHILGDGPLGNRYRALAGRLGLEPNCVWYGWVSLDRVISVMRECDVLFFPSLLEGVSTTVMEAISVGLPVICLRHCANSDILDESCSLMVEVGRLPEVVKGFQEAVSRLINNPELVEALSRGACARAREYSWDVVASRIHQVYLHAIGDCAGALRRIGDFSWDRKAEAIAAIYERVAGK